MPMTKDRYGRFIDNGLPGIYVTARSSTKAKKFLTEVVDFLVTRRTECVKMTHKQSE